VKFYEEFIKQERVWLDLPGVDLPDDLDWKADRAAALVRLGYEIVGWLGRVQTLSSPRPRMDGFSKQAIAG
jgi:hypothetical protein